MGPDLNAARDRAEEAEKEILELLRTKYHVDVPQGALSSFWERDWQRGKKRLKEGLKDLFVADACDSF